MNWRVVPASPEHIPQIAALEKRCFPADPWSEALFREALENPAAAVLLVQGEGGAVLGYAVLSVVLDEGSLDNIAVAPEFRRQGVADALLSTLTGFARGHLARLFLEVRASNAPALTLYRKYGFAEVGRRKNYYDNPREDAILMTWEIEHGNS